MNSDHPNVLRKQWREPDLISLVEQYLAINSNLSYINIDDMVDELQSKSFRYSRMKKQVFAGLVRKAYHEYCQRNRVYESNNLTVGSGVEDTANISSDSDIEIEEQPPKSSLVSSQLSNMYSRGKAPVPVSSILRTPDMGLLKQNHFNKEVKSHNNNQLQLVVSSKVVASSSTCTITRVSPNPPENVVAGVENSNGSVEEKNTDFDYDDSDELEIIDEVQGDGTPRRSSAAEGDTPDSTVRSQRYTAVIHQTPTASASWASEASSNKLSNTSSTSIKAIVNGAVNTTTTGSEIPLKSALKTIQSEKSEDIREHMPSNSTKEKRGTKRKTESSSVGSITDVITNELSLKRSKREVTVVHQGMYKLDDFAGSDVVLEEVCKLLMHLKHPEIYKTLGVTPPRGFLLHGPPGCGKTLLANAIAGELDMPMLKLAATELVSGVSGESECNIRDMFKQALALAPCIVFIDEIDSITPKRETAQREMERRIVAQLLACIDDLTNKENGDKILLIGATNRVEAIDTALRRAGRFDREICLGIPDQNSREKILRVICRGLRLASEFDFSLLAKLTPGYVGADLQSLTREAAVQSVNKVLISSKSSIVEDEPCNEESVGDSTINTGEEDKMDVDLESPTSTSVERIEDSHEISIILETHDAKPGNSNESTVPSGDKTVDDSKPVSSNEVTILPDDNAEVAKLESSNEVATGTIDKAEVNKMGISNEVAEFSEAKIEDNTKLMSSKDVASVSGEKIQSDAKVDSVTEVEAVPGENMECETECKTALECDVSPLRWIKDIAPLTQTELDSIFIHMQDFEKALKYVQPSSKREGFATVPDTTWNDVGALQEIRDELQVSILGPVKHSTAFQALGLNSPAGVLLCGPPGCGKTLLAKAVANEAGINFISVKGPELLNMYVGESERAVRQCFLRARNSSPCVIFFDELDALCPRRSETPESGSGSRVVNQLLTEMDGMESRLGVFVMAATNRPDIIDPAILRPGRLDKILFVGLPTAEDRLEIMKTITKDGVRPVLDDDVDLKETVNHPSCENYTGADLAALVREASIAAFRELVLHAASDKDPNSVVRDLKVSKRHFDIAFLKTKPSVTKKEREKYAEMKERFSSSGTR